MKSELLRKALMSKMANGGNLGDDKNKAVESKPKERRIGATTGVDLTEDIIINKDPSKISKDVNYGAWNNFQKFLRQQQIDGKPFIGNPALNTEEGRKYGQEAIDKYNTSEYVQKYPQNKITPEQILAIQQYHRGADPKVQVEGWLGSQTSRMRYPEPTLFYTKEGVSGIGAPKSKEGYVPVLWGNKQYVAPASTVSEQGFSAPSNYIPYDPSKHFESLQKPESQGPYYNVYQQYLPKTEKQEITTGIPKKKGGIVARYEGGGGVGDYNMFNLDAESPNMSDMDVKDSGIEDLSFDKNSVTDKTAKTNGKSSGNKKFNLSKLGGSGMISSAGNVTAGGIDALDRKDGRSSIAGQYASGFVKGGAKGLEIGMNPALMAATGGLSAAIGAGVGATIGGVSGAIRGKKERKERQKVGNISVQESAVASQEFDPLNPNKKPVKAENYNSKDYNKGLASLFANGGMVKQISNSANKINYATGGTIKGPGTGTSDSIIADMNKEGIEPGGFVVPANNIELAKGITKYILRKDPNRVAKFKKGGTPNSDKVAVSNGEYYFPKKEINEIVNHLGEPIKKALAPNAEENKEMANGGDVPYNKSVIPLKNADDSLSFREGYMEMLPKVTRNKFGEVAWPSGMLKSGEEMMKDVAEHSKKLALQEYKETKDYPSLRSMAAKNAGESAAYYNSRTDFDKKMHLSNKEIVDIANDMLGSSMFKRNNAYKFNTLSPIDQERVKKAMEYVSKADGGMIKRADGSYSKRGLWDNIRENAGSGKKPTPEMLKQEEKIKAELKKGGYVVKRSSERKGKTHVVIGPDGTKKYFGDSKLGQHPNNPARKKAFYARHEKNLKKNPYFRAFARETWADGGTVGSTMEKAQGGELSKEKAKTMLHDKKAHGKPLTDKQRKYFGWVAGGKKSMGGIVDKYANGGTMNRDWEWG